MSSFDFGKPSTKDTLSSILTKPELHDLMNTLDLHRGKELLEINLVSNTQV